MFMNFSPRMLSMLAGSIWLLAGANLLLLGAGFLLQSAESARFFTEEGGLGLPLLHTTMEWLPEQEFAMPLLACMAIALGFLKGKTVMRKAACREIQRIAALPQPISIFQLYSMRGALLLGLMFCLGFSLRFFQVPLDVRGFVDVAVGVALILGSMQYLRVKEVKGNENAVIRQKA